MPYTAIISDTHYGVRGDSIPMLNYFSRFYGDIFFPTLEKYEVKHIIHCGDLVDRRKFLNYNTATRLHNDFTNYVIENDIITDVVLGNHDVMYKNTNSINGPKILYGANHKNFRIFENPVEIELYNTKLLYCPWINSENMSETISLLDKSSAKYVFGHFEFSGFEMYKGHYADEGFNHNDLSKFQHVFTGHYHERSMRDNVTYIGAPYEMMWSDFNCTRGFELIDLETNERIYIKNPYSIFNRIIYDESRLMTFKSDMSQYKDTYVRISIINKTNQSLFDKFIDNLEKYNPIDIQIIDETLTFDMNRTDIDISETEDTLSIAEKYIDSIKMDIDKNKVKSKIADLYHEAINIERD